MCTSSTGLFYVMGSLGGKELAKRVNAVANGTQTKHPGPGSQFITVHGGRRIILAPFHPFLGATYTTPYATPHTHNTVF